MTIYKEGSILESGYSDSNGSIRLMIPVVEEGEILVTVTKQNHYPYQSSFQIYNPGASVNVFTENISVIENGSGSSNGNGDGQINSGEIVDLIEDKYFTVVNSQPIVYDVEEEILENYQQGNSTFWVNVTSNDFDGDIYRYEWRSNRQGALPCVTDECELDPSNLLPGVHEIRVYAVDEDEELSEPLIFEIVVLEEVYEEGSDSILADVYNSIFEGNPLLLGGALAFGVLSVLGLSLIHI